MSKGAVRPVSVTTRCPRSWLPRNRGGRSWQASPHFSACQGGPRPAIGAFRGRARVAFCGSGFGVVWGLWNFQSMKRSAVGSGIWCGGGADPPPHLPPNVFKTSRLHQSRQATAPIRPPVEGTLAKYPVQVSVVGGEHSPHSKLSLNINKGHLRTAFAAFTP